MEEQPEKEGEQLTKQTSNIRADKSANQSALQSNKTGEQEC